MQVLNSIGGKNDADEDFQEMFLVYGTAYPSHFPLISEKSWHQKNYFEPHICKNPSQNLFILIIHSLKLEHV